MLNRLLDRLDTTPGQEKVIREAVDTLHGRRARRTRRIARHASDVAQAIRGETLDRGRDRRRFRSPRRVIDRVRQNALDSFGKVHETLDERQRKILAELIEAGPFARGFGPFR